MTMDTWLDFLGFKVGKSMNIFTLVACRYKHQLGLSTQLNFLRS